MFALILSGAGALHADSTIIQQGTTPGSFSQTMIGPDGFTGYVYAGWQMGSSSYSNVSISVVLWGVDASDTVDAYLDDSIGPGTSVSNEIASVTDVNVSTTDYSSVLLFTGLTLNAGESYYLTIAPDGSDTVYWGIDNSQPSPTAAPGVSEYDAGFCNDDIAGCDIYPPNSPFVDLGANPIFTVDAVPTAATPEPASAELFAGGIALAAFVRYRRRSKHI